MADTKSWNFAHSEYTKGGVALATGLVLIASVDATVELVVVAVTANFSGNTPRSGHLRRFRCGRATTQLDGLAR